MDIYVVQPGDDLETIANKFGISVTKLIQDNGLDETNFLVPGQTLVIVYPEQTHIVQEGDTLLSIANTYNITIMQLLRNNIFLLNREYIYPGETLTISYKTNGSILTHGFCYPFINQESLIKTLPFLTYLSIFNYQATDKGELKAYYDDSNVIQMAKTFGVIPLMLATTLTPLGEANIGLDYTILLNEEYQDTLINNILVLLNDKGYYGVNFVFNFINTSNQTLYQRLISKVSERLTEHGYLTFVTVNINFQSVNNEVTFEKIDYTLIGQKVNAIIFLNFLWGTNYGPPAPVSSISHLRTFMNYIISMVPIDKIIIGKPVISYDWLLPYEPGRSSANSLSIDATLQLAYDVGATIQFDEISQTPFFYYMIHDSNQLSNSTEQHIVWSIDARSINALVELIKEYKILGTGIWNIMIFHDQLWLILNSQFSIEKISEW